MHKVPFMHNFFFFLSKRKAVSLLTVFQPQFPEGRSSQFLNNSAPSHVFCWLIPLAVHLLKLLRLLKNLPFPPWPHSLTCSLVLLRLFDSTNCGNNLDFLFTWFILHKEAIMLSVLKGRCLACPTYLGWWLNISEHKNVINIFYVFHIFLKLLKALEVQFLSLKISFIDLLIKVHIFF